MNTNTNTTMKKTLARVGTVFGALLLLQGCALENQINTLKDDKATSYTYTGHIRISLAHPFDVKKEDYEILAATPNDVAALALCHIKEGGACEPGSPLYYTSELVYATSQARFFKVEASALLEDGLTVQLMSYDKAGKVTDTRRLTLNAKAGTVSPSTTTATPPTTTPSTSTTTTTTATPGTSGAPDVNTIVANSCASASCHPGRDAASFKGADAAGRVQNGSMPKGGSLSAADKQALVSYLQN
jgi:hypothetical protein